jgi:rhomboid protease GluP
MDIVTLLILITVVIYVLPYIVPFAGPTADSFTNFLMTFWQQKESILNGEYYRLITSIFLHGSVLHIFMNMYTLWQSKSFLLRMGTIAAPSLARVPNNSIVFIVVYLISGIGGNLLSMIFTKGPSVGASGAILGLFGYITAFGLVTNNSNILNNMLINIAILALIGFAVPNIDNWAHAGGFITGMIMYFGLFYFLRI